MYASRLCCHNVLVTEESPLRQLHTEWVGSTLQWCKGSRIWTELFCSNTICALQRNAWIKSMNDTSEPISANERLKVTEWHRKVRATWYHHSNKDEKNQGFFHLCISPHFCHLFLVLYYEDTPSYLPPSFILTRPMSLFLLPTLNQSTLSLIIRLLKLSSRLLTPSSSTQQAHSVLWDELWLILFRPSPPSLFTYLPTFLQLSLILPPSLPLSFYRVKN